MAYRYEWKCASCVDGESVITLVRYETLESLLEEHYQCTIEDLEKSEHGGYDGEGKEWNFTFEEMCNSIRTMGCYAFADNKQSIHFWVDVDHVDPIDFVGMIAHEKGHLVRPFKRDPMKEEIKAERYGDAASFAFEIARSVLKERITGVAP